MEEKNFNDFLNIIRKLRSKDGCPWDREQTHESLRFNLIEEAYESAEAIDQRNSSLLCEELGDVLLLVVMQSVIAEEAGEFTINDVLKGIAEKMVFRHPHVFGEQTPNLDSTQVLEQWEELKKAEKKEENASDGLERVAKSLPANIRAEKVQKKASKAGLDFTSCSQIWEKVQEELKELEIAFKNRDMYQMEEEFGDLMFTIVNLSRFLQINAENSLTNATNKFINRFVSVERLARGEGLCLTQLSGAELDALWGRVK